MSKSRAVVLADDWETIFELLFVVGQMGWEPAGATSSLDSAVQLAREHSANFILMDPSTILTFGQCSEASFFDELPNIMLLAIKPGEDGFVFRATKNGREYFMFRDFLDTTGSDEELQLLH